MRVLRGDLTNQKGWHTGPWDSDLMVVESGGAQTFLDSSPDYFHLGQKK
jgi:hypothetical protein